MMLYNLAHLQLLPAMQQPGCPICRLRNECEKHFLDRLLLERVNDGETRDHLSASLGFCPKHTWEMGLLDLATYEEPVKNSMIYEYLVKYMLNQLSRYRKEEISREKGARGWFRRLIRKRRPYAFEQDPFARVISKGCYVCQVGEQDENCYLSCLINGFVDESNEIREAYQASEGLCMYHFRRAFVLGDGSQSSGLGFLVETTVRKMESLENDLTEFIEKHGLGRSHEPLTAGERSSWLRALRFVGMHEDYTLLGHVETGTLEADPCVRANESSSYEPDIPAAELRN